MTSEHIPKWTKSKLTLHLYNKIIGGQSSRANSSLDIEASNSPSKLQRVEVEKVVIPSIVNGPYLERDPGLRPPI